MDYHLLVSGDILRDHLVTFVIVKNNSLMENSLGSLCVPQMQAAVPQIVKDGGHVAHSSELCQQLAGAGYH